MTLTPNVCLQAMAAANATATQPQGGAGDARELPGLTKIPWGMQDLAPRYSQLAQDTQADICVVGAGIVGLSIAYNLQKKAAQRFLASGIVSRLERVRMRRADHRTVIYAGILVKVSCKQFAS